jgi:hypothetical protein
MTLASKINFGACVETSLRSSVCTESNSSDSDAGLGSSPKWTEKTSLPGRLTDSVACKLLANRIAVRRTAKTSSTSAKTVIPTTADEFGETSSAGWTRALVLIAVPP